MKNHNLYKLMMLILAFEQNYLVPVAKTVITEPVKLIYHIKCGHEITKNPIIENCTEKKSSEKPLFCSRGLISINFGP